MVQTNSHANLREQALRLVELGLSVLPVHGIQDGICMCGTANESCKPGKHPIGELVPHGHKNASSEPDQVAAWWQRYPAANVGIACGPSGLIVVDEDPRNTGDETLADLKLSGNSLPDTVISSTGGGGRHYFYRRPPDMPEKDFKLGPGIDIKIGGYVIAPPSLHESGNRYEWHLGCDPFDGAPFSDAPEWLVRGKSPNRTETPSDNRLNIDWDAHCPQNVERAIKSDPHLGQLWEAKKPLSKQKDSSPSGFRFLLQGALASRGFSRREVMDASVAFSNLRSSNRPSDQAISGEVISAFERTPATKPNGERFGRIANGSIVESAFEAVLCSNPINESAALLLMAMARRSLDGATVTTPDVQLAQDLGWAIEHVPSPGSRRIRRNKKALVNAGLITPKTRPVPGRSVTYALNLKSTYPIHRTQMSYE